MDVVNGYGAGSGPGAIPRVRIRLSVNCMGRIGLRMCLCSRINVRVLARLRFMLRVHCAVISGDGEGMVSGAGIGLVFGFW